MAVNCVYNFHVFTWCVVADTNGNIDIHVVSSDGVTWTLVGMLYGPLDSDRSFMYTVEADTMTTQVTITKRNLSYPNMTLSKVAVYTDTPFKGNNLGAYFYAISSVV